MTMSGVCVRLGEAKPPKKYPKPNSPQTSGIAYIFGLAICYV